MIAFEVDRQDLRHTRLSEAPEPPLADGAVRLRPRLLAMTSNNVTYAAMGEGELGYYDFFPAPEGWGRPPAWGFAVVEASRAEGVEAGDRFYGYYPLATCVDATPTTVSARGFVDGAPHRRDKAAIYNLYQRTSTDPAYVAGREAEQALFRPLYATGWWLADFVSRMAGGPGPVVFSSASAKTAIATAHQLRRLGAPLLLALTSPANLAYVESTGLYDQAFSYGQVAALKGEQGAVFIDFLGREDLIASVHGALGDTLTRSVMVGATQWSAKPGGIGLPRAPVAGPEPEFFFVPSYASARLSDSGAELGRTMRRDLVAFYESSAVYVEPTRSTGAAAFDACWRNLCNGATDPRCGLTVAL
jgi:hypothetical protein